MKKDFTRRDSATAFLRKNGIDKADYNDYIRIVTDQHGSIFTITLDDVDGTPVSNKAKSVKIITRSESVAKRDAEKAVAAPVKTNGEKRTVSSAIRDLIKAGKTNGEIWATVQPEFKLADNKKHYPAWYRSELNRKGA